MKKVLLTLAAVATLAACSTEKTMDFAKDAIAFDNAFVDNATKSVSDPSYTNTKLFGDFAVFGFVEGAVLFNEKPVTGSGINGTWTYSGTQYWIEGAKYNFAAVAPYTDRAWSVTSFAKGETNLSFTNSGTQDVLYAQPTEITAEATGNEKVAFTFRHILSKVKFSFENKYIADNTTIRVRDIKILNAHAAGNVKLTSGEPVWSDQDGTLVLEFGNAATNAVDALEPMAHNAVVESYNELLLIPGAVTNDYTVQFTYDILVGGTKVKEFTKTSNVDFDPAPGKAYDFKASITPGQAIEFTVSEVKGWDTTPGEDTM